jgi:hypothetical protein
MHVMNASHLTVRRVPPAIMSALAAESKRRGTSRNQTVIDLLGQALGTNGRKSSGLSRFAGGWSEEEFREFESATAPFGQIDSELWR